MRDQTRALRSPVPIRRFGREVLLSWSAASGAAIAVLAWAACCVLPIALSVAGISLAGLSLLAGQRTWLTLGAGVLLAAGWYGVWRRRRACALDAACPPTPRSALALLGVATLLVSLALIWQPVVEPRALMLLRGLRG